MSAERSTTGRSHAAAWTVSVLAAPLLYLLTLPPLVIATGTPHRHGVQVAEGLKPYCLPWGWLAKNTPMHSVMADYYEWWMEALLPAKPVTGY